MEQERIQFMAWFIRLISKGMQKGRAKRILRMTKQITAVLAGDIGGTKTNLALRMLAFSGIYLGGGIPPRRPLNERQAVK
jgi:hypothetical protein